MTLSEPFGARAPGPVDRAVIAITRRLPDNWLGLRLSILLRRITTMRMPEDGGMDVIRWGMRMRLHPHNNVCEKLALFTPQIYDSDERRFLFGEIDATISAGRPFTFVDIGANVGLYSLPVAARAGERGKVLAVEPDPGNLKRLRFSVSANPGVPVTIVPLALGDENGRVVLRLDPRNHGGTRTLPLGAEDAAGGTTVECRPLLDVLQENSIAAIDALKIDVEGNEDTILVPFFRDADPALWPRVIVIEESTQFWRTDLLAVFAANGYVTAARSRINIMLRRA